LAIFAAAASGLFVLWQWSRQRKNWVQTQGFTPYIERVTNIEKQAMQIDRAQPSAVGQLAALGEELGKAKTEALDRFTQGELEGKDLLVGFLTQVADLRECLARRDASM
jgi:hypothetical protein